MPGVCSKSTAAGMPVRVKKGRIFEYPPASVETGLSLRLNHKEVISIWAMCIFGVLFSIYLTFLEPFVIGATCMWCISSAVLMIVLLLASTPAAQQALAINEE